MPRKLKEVENENKKSAPERVADKPAEKSFSNDAKQRVLGKAEQMKEHLSKQPKVSILIPLEKGEKRGAKQPFCINGYKFEVPKGVMTQVPEQVAQMIAERFEVELNVRGQSLDHRDRETRSALEAL